MQYAAKFQGESKFFHGPRIFLRALFCVALVTLSLAAQPSSSSDRAKNPGCVAMAAHVVVADHMASGESGDHCAGSAKLHLSMCSSAGCLSAYVQEGLPAATFASNNTVVFSMFERERGAGRAVSPEYRPPITG